jgi:ribonuclease BN (tRNA processing enzyme)
MHADHYFDLVPLYYGLKYGPPRSPELGARLPLWIPPTRRGHIDRLGDLVEGEPSVLDEVYEVAGYPLGDTMRIGAFSFAFLPVQHYVPSHAMRVEGGGRRLVYSSDAGPSPALVEAARDADVFLCEAGARRLLLTHYRRDGGSLEAQHRARAEATFGGAVDLADEGKMYVV